MSDFVLTPAREKELEKIAKDLPDKSFKDLYGKDWKSIKIATAMNILKKKYGFKTEETKMKFKEIREKIRSKMSRSKLTGQEVSTYYRKNPSAKKAARDPKIKKAIEFALDHGGAMTYAIKNIEKMKRGLASHPEVAKALEFANFGEEVMREALALTEVSKYDIRNYSWPDIEFTSSSYARDIPDMMHKKGYRTYDNWVDQSGETVTFNTMKWKNEK